MGIFLLKVMEESKRKQKLFLYLEGLWKTDSGALLCSQYPTKVPRVSDFNMCDSLLCTGLRSVQTSLAILKTQDLLGFRA